MLERAPLDDTNRMRPDRSRITNGYPDSATAEVKRCDRHSTMRPSD
jgi:hypothetical protein